MLREHQVVTPVSLWDSCQSTITASPDGNASGVTKLPDIRGRNSWSRTNGLPVPNRALCLLSYIPFVDLLGSAPRSKTLPRAALRPVETILRPILVFSMETSRTRPFSIPSQSTDNTRLYHSSRERNPSASTATSFSAPSAAGLKDLMVLRLYFSRSSGSGSRPSSSASSASCATACL